MRFGIAKPKKATVITTSKNDGHQPLGVESYNQIEEAIQYKFTDISWLERALTHRSVRDEGGRSDYERLEFLGDAVFDLAVAHLLSDQHPTASEGELSKMRAALVNTDSLAVLARKINLGAFIRLGRGEISSGGQDRPSILADVLEATIGAVYRDSGYDTAFKCVTHLLGSDIATVTPRDPKTELQEALHAIGSEAPEYLLEFIEGPEHAPTFVSIVKVDGEIVGRGRGPTKKASQQVAAAEALEKLKSGDEIDQMVTKTSADTNAEITSEEAKTTNNSDATKVAEQMEKA